jgi:hypothetical protein
MTLLIVTLITSGAALLARWGLLRIEPDPQVLGRVPFVALCAVGVGWAWVAHAVAGAVPASVAGIVPVALVGQLMLAAWIDRQTTWVPDSVLVPTLCLAGLHVVSGRLGTTGGEVLAGLGLGLVVWLVSLVLWRVQTALNHVVFTPPDMIAAVLPLMLLGTSFAASLVYLLTALLALAMLKSPLVRCIFVNELATEEGARHLGLPEDRPALPALSLFLPVLSIVFMARSGVENFGFKLYL